MLRQHFASLFADPKVMLLKPQKHEHGQRDRSADVTQMLVKSPNAPGHQSNISHLSRLSHFSKIS